MEKLLVLCAGRRVGLLQNLKTAMEQMGGQVIAQDIDENAPALYHAHKRWVPASDNVRSVFEFCEMEGVQSVIALIDPMISTLAGYQMAFDEAGIRLFQPDPETVKICHDKSRMGEIENLNVPRTVIVKPRYGSASRDQERIVQPLLPGQEWNVAAYFDYFTGQMIDCFMQRKIWMRAGETERGISDWNAEILQQLFAMEQHHGFRGPVDIDMIESEGKIWVIDINPRFGGGYQMAAACGVNLENHLVQNILGKTNRRETTRYKTGVRLMKYDVIEVHE